MNIRLIPLVFALLSIDTLRLSAQNSVFGKKDADPAPPATAPADAPTNTTSKNFDTKSIPTGVDNQAVVITPARLAVLPEPQAKRTFSLSRASAAMPQERYSELIQEQFTKYASQHVVDASPMGWSNATGYVTTLQYTLLQSLGDNRYLAKASWQSAGHNQALPAGVDTMAILLLEKAAKVGDSGNITAMNVGLVSLLFTPNFPPHTAKQLTLSHEAFVQCQTLNNDVEGLKGFIESIVKGNELTMLTYELYPCKPCIGLGFTRVPQPGVKIDKRVPCKDCAASGKVPTPIETRFVP